jgi:hypothetical protein
MADRIAGRVEKALVEIGGLQEGMILVVPEAREKLRRWIRLIIREEMKAG